MRIARTYEANPALAEELGQDIYLAVWQALPTFRQEATARTFIARIAHNRAISHVTRAAREAKSVPFDLLDPTAAASPHPSPEAAAIQADLRVKLEEAVRNLPLGMKIAATLMLEGFSPAETAEVIGITPSAASVRLHRAKGALEKMFAEDE